MQPSQLHLCSLVLVPLRRPRPYLSVCLSLSVFVCVPLRSCTQESSTLCPCLSPGYFPCQPRVRFLHTSKRMVQGSVDSFVRSVTRCSLWQGTRIMLTLARGGWGDLLEEAAVRSHDKKSRSLASCRLAERRKGLKVLSLPRGTESWLPCQKPNSVRTPFRPAAGRA